MDNHLVITASRQANVLNKGHLGIENCKARVKTSVYWLKISDSICIEQLVKQYTGSQSERTVVATL